MRSASGAEFRAVVKPAGRRDPELRTERLWLRRWTDADIDELAALNADAEVMEHFPGVLTRRQSWAQLRRLEATFERCGYGFWAAELEEESRVIGLVGLQPVPEGMPFAPGVEVGWRLARPYWGKSLAYEGARAALAFAFEQLRAEEVVAYTAQRNMRSRRLMERLGMRYDAGADFDHPGIARTSPLAAHVLYRLTR